jgi:hypothetical protein
MASKERRGTSSSHRSSRAVEISSGSSIVTVIAVSFRPRLLGRPTTELVSFHWVFLVAASMLRFTLQCCDALQGFRERLPHERRTADLQPAGNTIHLPHQILVQCDPHSFRFRMHRYFDVNAAFILENRENGGAPPAFSQAFSTRLWDHWREWRRFPHDGAHRFDSRSRCTDGQPATTPGLCA